MISIYKFENIDVIDIDAEVPESILADVDWNMLDVGDPIHDDSGLPIALVAEKTEDSVTIKPIEE